MKVILVGGAGRGGGEDGGEDEDDSCSHLDVEIRTMVILICTW